MKNLFQTLIRLNQQLSDGLSRLYTPAAIAARIYLAQVFFLAGLTKIQDWETTLFLFEEEYQVPILPYDWAAFLGTSAELILPIFLVVGLLTRFTALGLLFVNIVAVISLVDIAPAALYLHVIWGVLLAQLSVSGGGAWSLDSIGKGLAEVKLQQLRL